MFASMFVRGLSKRRSNNIMLLSKTKLGIPCCCCFNTSVIGSIRSFTYKTSLQGSEHSFMITYLVNSCGLSLTSAKSVSELVKFETPEKANSVIDFLRRHGFSNAHISKLVRVKPKVLLSDLEKTLLPKIEFFRSVGLSSADIVRVLCSNPGIFYRNVENYLIPVYDSLKSVLILDEKVVMAFKNSPRFMCRPLRHLVSNLAFLRNLGLPQSSISLLVSSDADLAFSRPCKFELVAKEIEQMGFDPLKSSFIQAMRVLTSMNKSCWISKFEIYGRWGWSRDDTLLAFKRFPPCMSFSEKNIMTTMDFLLNKMGWQPAAIARVPTVLGYSLEKRIVPRCSVIRVLMLKGLLKAEEVHLSSVLIYTQKKFLKLFVIKYQEDVPQLLSIFRGEMSILELGFGFEENFGAESL